MKKKNVFVVGMYQWILSCCLDVKPQHEVYVPDYNYYHNLSQIYSHISQIWTQNIHYMKIDSGFKSKEGRPQILLHITNFTEIYVHQAESIPSIPKVKVLLSYGEHAREFLPIETLFNLLHNLTDGLQSEKESPQEMFSKTILSKFDLYIIVMANPDGRKIVEESQNYCWRGTSSGVDLNRNFDWEFGDAGSSPDPKDEEYRGKFPFSEIESEVYRKITSEREFDAFISFHSGIRHIYLPFADSKSKMSGREPPFINSIKELAQHLASSTKYRYSYGKAYDLSHYTADGTIFDYMAGKANIPISMAIELWGRDKHFGPSCFDEFNPKSTSLKREVADIHPLYVAMFDFLLRWKEIEYQKKIHLINEVPSMTFGYILLGIVIMITLFVAFHRRWCPCNNIFPRKRIVSLRALGSSLTVWGVKSS